MAEVVVSAWVFSSPDEADAAFKALGELGGADGDLADAAMIDWPESSSRPGWVRLAPLATDGGVPARRLDDAFWELTFGLVFYLPLLKAAFGRSDDPLLASDPAIDRTLVNRLRDEVVPGTSAVMIFGSPAWIERTASNVPWGTAQRLYEFPFSERFIAITEAFIDTEDGAE